MELRVDNERVYSNGTIRFTTGCYYKGDSRPEGDQYHIKYVYLWKEPINFWKPVMEFNSTPDGGLEFNKSLGDIQDATKVTIIKGNLSLAVDEEARFEFHTLFSLPPTSVCYVGVIAIGPSGFHRWETNTTVLVP